MKYKKYGNSQFENNFLSRFHIKMNDSLNYDCIIGFNVAQKTNFAQYF